jgi:hypothetical protein
VRYLDFNDGEKALLSAMKKTILHSNPPTPSNQQLFTVTLDQLIYALFVSGPQSAFLCSEKESKGKSALFNKASSHSLFFVFVLYISLGKK